MAGSIADFIYQAGNGEDYWMRTDKSNSILMGNQPVQTTARPGVPRSIEMRYAVYQSIDNKVTRKIPIGSRTANITNLPQSFSDAVINANGSGAVYLRRFVAEEFALPNTVDTGLTAN